jgi:hypothetical protein
MKKFILPLLVLLFVGSLYAVESAPSEVVGYVKYDLVAGNNTIALPMDQPYNLASELGDEIGASAVRFFNLSSQEWQSANSTPFGWTGDFDISNAQALWVSLDAAGTFYSLGAVPETIPSYNLIAGNNMIMLPLNQGELNMASLVGTSIGASAVLFFNAGTQEWESANSTPFGWTGDFDTAIGDPLWISTDAAGTWPAPATRAIQGINSRN